MLQERKSDIDNQLTAGVIKPLELMQQRRDFDTQPTAIVDEPDMTAAAAGFVEHAASYGQRKGIQYAT